MQLSNRFYHDPPNESDLFRTISLIASIDGLAYLVHRHRWTDFVLLAVIVGFLFIVAYHLWLAFLVAIALWVPFSLILLRRIRQQCKAMAVFFVLLLGQSVHFLEHCAQMAQIHLLGVQPGMAHGVLGAAFDVETMHFGFDSLFIPICLLIIGNGLKWMRHPTFWKWFTMLGVIALWHAAEHFVIMYFYVFARPGVTGNPGLLAMHGLLWGGLPISRPDLHFIYNATEELFIVLCFLIGLRARGISMFAGGPARSKANNAGRAGANQPRSA